MPLQIRCVAFPLSSALNVLTFYLRPFIGIRFVTFIEIRYYSQNETIHFISVA